MTKLNRIDGCDSKRIIHFFNDSATCNVYFSHLLARVGPVIAKNDNTDISNTLTDEFSLLSCLCVLIGFHVTQKYQELADVFSETLHDIWPCIETKTCSNLERKCLNLTILRYGRDFIRNR